MNGNENCSDFGIYSLDSGCPLSESQLNVYLDESVKDMGTSYNMSFKIKFSKSYSAEEIKKAIYKLAEIFPVLSARILVDENRISFRFDGKLQISIGSIDDIDSFVQPFELDKCLSRFLIIEEESILCIDCHHLILDSTSRIIFLNKLSDILDGTAIGSVDDGVLRQSAFEEKLSEDDLNQAKEFFDAMLSDMEEVYDLMPSIAKDKCDGELYCDFNLDSAYLKSFLENHSITYIQFFTSVFAYTLSRFTGSPKAFFNLIVNGRTHMDLKDSVGMFVRTLPLLFNCENQKIGSFLKYNSTLINSAMKYDFYPYSQLANEYDFSSNILFQYVYNLIYNSDESKNISSVEELEHDKVGDLSFYVYNHENYFKIRVTYSNKYSKDLIEHFVESYKSIAEEIINKKSLNEIKYTIDSDLNLLDNLNNTETELRYNNILAAFNDNLSKYPNNTLVIDDNAKYTYRESAYLINSLNSLLKQNEISENETVTIFVDRNHWALLSSLSCLSLGVTYVPIDENYPDKRIAFMIKQSDSKAIITTDTFQTRLKNISEEFELKTDIINISSLENHGDKTVLEANSNSDYVDYVEDSSNDVACILYTSGTTGTPKAVQMARLGILNLIEFYIGSTGFTEEDVQGIFASVGFDVSLEQFASIFTGGAVTYVPNEILLDIKKLNDYFIKHNVTHTLITTQIAKLFVNTISKTSLKYLQTAGEKLGDIRPPKEYILSDVYGPTEANYITSIDVDKKIGNSSVGFPNWNTKLYILDEEQRRVPLSAVGEIYISGYQTTKGYLDNPDENEKALFQNPFNENQKGYEIMYKTGDLGRILPDGSIGIVGRADSQVKIRGNRVELSEIEVTIRNIDHIQDVTVQTVNHDGNNELSAYVVLDSKFDGKIKDYIQNHIRELKPEYMVPAFVIQLNEIPVNANGKVDKRALPQVDLKSLRAEYIAPRNEKEKTIVEAFEKVFNQEKISILDDFTVLGGDSLSAIKLISHIPDYNVSAADILSLKTPKAIAESIEKNEFDLDIYSLENGCPLNESQLNVYLDIASDSKVDSYLVQFSMVISKEYSSEDIFSALYGMFDAHPILEMSISDDFEVPYMVKGVKPSIEHISGFNRDHIIEFLSVPFNLKNSLSRYLIVETEDEYVLFAVLHHLISDALSLDVFKKDFRAILKGEKVGLDDSFLKVAAFNHQIQETKGFEEAKLFYDKMLAESDDISLLLDDVRSNGPGFVHDKLNLNIDGFLDEHNVSANVLFTSVFAYTLSRFVGDDKVLFNILENGRSRFNNFNSIGMFVNTLPLAVDCRNQDVDSFLEYISDLIYGVMKYNFILSDSLQMTIMSIQT